MGRRANALGLAFLAIVAIGAWLLFGPPPTRGAGWRLDPDASWPPVAGDLVPTVVPYATDDDGEVGLGITVYDSSSCAPTLRDVHIGSAEVTVRVSHGLAWGGCTADAAPHLFGLVFRRDALPALPFEVVIDADERDDRVPISNLP